MLLHAEKWRIPVIFVLNKTDLFGSSAQQEQAIAKARSTLVNICARMLENGQLRYDWSLAAERAIPVSAATKQNLQAVVDAVHSLPVRDELPPSLSLTPDQGFRFRDVARRTDMLVGVESSPVECLGVVLEVTRSAECGTVATVLIQHGALKYGQPFVCGSSFGKVSSLLEADDVAMVRRSVEIAVPGMAVRVGGARPKMVGQVKSGEE